MIIHNCVSRAPGEGARCCLSQFFSVLRRCLALLIVIVGASRACRGETVAIFPGVSAIPQSGGPGGRLVFLLANDAQRGATSSNAASIYQVDCRSGRSLKICDCPVGNPTFSRDGMTVCIDYRPVKTSWVTNSHLFAWSVASGTGQALVLQGGAIDEIAVEDEHVVVRVSNGVVGQVYDYTFATQVLRHLDALTKRMWGRPVLETPAPPAGCTNYVEFYLGKFGDPQGFDVVLERAHKTRDIFQTFDGRYLFFAGDEGPTGGISLITAPRKWSQIDWDDPVSMVKGRKTIKTFGRWDRIFGDMNYELLQLSPDGRYALVCGEEKFEKGARHKVDTQSDERDEVEDIPWSKRTYYLVDVKTAKVIPLLKDEASHDMFPAPVSVRWFAN